MFESNIKEDRTDLDLLFGCLHRIQELRSFEGGTNIWAKKLKKQEIVFPQMCLFLFLTEIAIILETARKNANTAVNLVMGYSCFEVGRRIVEEEQNGRHRAEYGAKLLIKLFEYLTEHIGKGFSVTNLKQMQNFYQVYESDQIGQTLSDQFNNLPTVSKGRKFVLSWLHYLKLMRISNIDERHFYEIEAAI